MNTIIRILFSKVGLIYIIIILSLVILFNNSKKQKIINNTTEGFEDNSIDLGTIKAIYEEEKKKYLSMFKNGEEIFNSIIDLSLITSTTDIENLIEPSVIADLGTNLQTDIITLTTKIFNKFEKLNINEVDNYLSGEYISDQDNIINKYLEYPDTIELIKKEINDILLEKIDYLLSNIGNSSNFKTDEKDYSINNTSKGVSLNDFDNKLYDKVKDVNNMEKIITAKRTLTYIRNKIAPSEEANEEELKKLLESFYNPISTISTSSETTTPDNSLMTETTITGPLMSTPKSFDGFTKEELEIIQRNQIANTPKNIDTVLIDPLKAVETVQGDLLGLLEKFNDSNNNKKKKEYLDRQFDPTNRGSYLINSPNTYLTDNKIENLSYYSKPSNYSKKILSPKEKIKSELSNKEYRKIDDQLTKPAIKEGFESQSEIVSLFDGFVKYSSNIIKVLINNLTSGTINIDSFDNNKMQSYGIIIIAISILLFFISSTS
jgi:hypothetical protein